MSSCHRDAHKSMMEKVLMRCDSCMKYTVVYTAHDKQEYKEEIESLEKALKWAEGLKKRGFTNVKVLDRDGNKI